MQSRTGRAVRDAEGLGDLRQVQAQVVMQDEDGSLVHRQAPEDSLELVAIHDGQQAIRPGRPWPVSWGPRRRERSRLRAIIGL